MGVAIPWMIMLGFQSYQHGIKQHKMPEPYYFLGATAVMGIAGIIAMANPTVGALFAWAMLSGAFVSGNLKSVPINSEQVKLKTKG